jgi:8-amino-7-oxononanoate synthase
MAPSALEKSMSTALSKRRQNSTLRALTLPKRNQVDFSSNDFLSLSTSPLLKSAFLSELSHQTNSAQFRLGSSGSRLLDGNSRYAEDLEVEIAAFHGAESGLLFNSGFDANAGFFACVPQRGDVVVYDALIHASVHEGMRMSRAAKRVAFKHNDVSDLEKVLGEVNSAVEGIKEGKRSVFIAVEGLYSMDGDVAPLREIVETVERCLPLGNGHIIVDEAHSTGIYGEKGRGIVCSLDLERRIFARLHTFGKALGCNGGKHPASLFSPHILVESPPWMWQTRYGSNYHVAILLSTPLVRTYLINYCRPLIYTTFSTYPSLCAIRASYSLLQSGATDPLALHLRHLIQHLFSQLQALDRSIRISINSASTPESPHFPQKSKQDLLQRYEKLFHPPPSPPPSPIFAVLSAEPGKLAAHCQAEGYMVRPIVYPTVPQGTERVRVCLHAGNTVEQVEGLVVRMGEWLRRELNLPSERPEGRIKAKL